MKNKILVLGASVLLLSGVAFGFAQSTNGTCCKVEASTCCPDPDHCPIPCCESGSSTECKK